MIYFIRHAESQYNAAERVIEEQLGKDYMNTETYLTAKFHPQYLDVEITERGEEQARKAREEVHGLQVDAVLVSPLRRALHTCALIFEDHPSRPPVFVEPAFREIMESSNDIGSEIAQSILKYPFDFSAITDPNAWFVSTLHPADRHRIEALLEGLEGEGRKQRAIEECLALERENWAERRERREAEEALKERVLPDLEEQGRVIEAYAKKYKTIAIVAHSECIKRYAGYKIANCQVFPYPLK